MAVPEPARKTAGILLDVRVPGRPTFAVLKSLGADWTDPADRSAVMGGQKIPGPLHELGHPIVSHTAATFITGEDQDVKRESISGLTNPVWWKVKTNRWRGAVYQDPNGIFWLCAADLRREGERTDFYKQFMAEVERSGPAGFLPTEDDQARLRLELAEARLDEWERRIHCDAGEALVAAMDTKSADFTIASLTGDQPLCAVKVEVDLVNDDDPAQSVAEVLITIERLDWGQADLAEESDIIVLAAIQPDEQAWDVINLGGHPLYTLTMGAAELESLVGSHEPTATPGRTCAGTISHYAHKSRITEGAILGKGVRSLCGTWFVPRQDAELLPTCPSCEALHRNLRS